jgi:hypothetical protein
MNKGLPTEIYKHWKQSSQEKDSDPDVLFFKIPNSDFHQTRGQRSIEFQKDGKITIYQLGPDDRPTKSSGSFTFEEPDKINVIIEDDKISSFTMKIISLQNNTLQIKILR